MPVIRWACASRFAFPGLRSWTRTEDMIRNVLVVDDEKLVRWSIRKLIGADEYNVVCVANGKEAIEKLKHEWFALIITDLVMPDINGIEVARRARELQPDAEIIMMTAYRSLIDQADAQAAGISAFLNKPFMIQEVKRLVSQLLACR